jgi:hypothetical protein
VHSCDAAGFVERDRTHLIFASARAGGEVPIAAITATAAIQYLGVMIIATPAKRGQTTGVASRKMRVACGQPRGKKNCRLARAQITNFRSSGCSALIEAAHGFDGGGTIGALGAGAGAL